MDFKRLNAISNKSKGIICILFAALGFSFMTFFVRISGDIPTMEKAFFRNAVAIVVSLFMLVRTKEKISIKKGCGGDIFFRCLFGTSGLIANFYAIDRLNIADANMLNKLSPFFAILSSGTVRIIWRLWCRNSLRICQKARQERRENTDHCSLLFSFLNSCNHSFYCNEFCGLKAMAASMPCYGGTFCNRRTVWNNISI